MVFMAAGIRMGGMVRVCDRFFLRDLRLSEVQTFHNRNTMHYSENTVVEIQMTAYAPNKTAH